MDNIERYRSLIESILADLAKIPYAHGEIELQTVFDRERDHYVLMLVGRDGIRRVHGSLVHIDIKGGKVWIRAMARSTALRENCSRREYPRTTSCSPSAHPEMRKATDFAVV